MRHLLVSSGDEGLVDRLRTVLPPGSVLFTARGVDDTLERLGRSSRVDVVVTDDPEVEAAIREEVPGTLPVVLLPAGVKAADAVRAIAALGDA
ncbi:MAG: hypothetical protein IPP07_12360 [Holophagales bacterium]|nr:hypothetical protein [Holophagales bacterium]MBK9965645.1 hypothetical protein [Holophagales bacterium]